MIKLLSTSILALTLGLAACQQDPQSANAPSSMPLKTGTTGGTSTAHPAWTFEYGTLIKRVSYSTVSVSDSDGTHLASVYTSSSSALKESSPTWSANGASVSFVERPANGGWGAYAIKAVDVAVNSSGVPVGSNTRTIYSRATSDSLQILNQAWCPNSSVARIAFIAKSPAGWGIYTVATSGGTATQVYAPANTSDLLSYMTWSNDGSQIAFLIKSGGTLSIKVLDLSTGSITATLVSGTYVNIAGLVWSNSGANLLAYSASTTTNNTSDFYLYTLAPTSGSTPTLVSSANGFMPFWSPNNSELAHTHYDASTGTSTVKTAVANGSVSTVGTGTPYGDWK